METTSKPRKKKSRITKEIERRAKRLWLMSNNPGGSKRREEDRVRIYASEYAACRDDFFYWIKNYGWLHDPHAKNPRRSTIPFLMWPKQVELAKFLISGMDTGRNRHVNKARSIGASWTALQIIVHRFLFEPGFTAKVGSRKEELVDDKTMDSLFGKVRWILKKQPKFFLPSPKDMVDNYLLLKNNDNGAEILGEATNAGFGRGGRRKVVFIDEFAHIESPLQVSTWTSLETVALSVWSVSTPNGKGNQFHINFIRSPNEDKMQVDWKANPKRTEEWFEGLLAENGGKLSWDQRAQEHECNFAGVSGYRIIHAERSKVSYNDEWLLANFGDARDSWPLVVSGDVGSGPSLTSFANILFSWQFGNGKFPLVLIDNEVCRERTSAYSIAKDVLFCMGDYGGRRFVVGEPVAKAKDPQQESWESHFRSAGLPFSSLPASYNDPFVIRETLGEINELVRLGLFRVHERCLYIMECIESWEWDLPRGMTLEMVNKESLKPKKNIFSHPGDGLRYGTGFILRSLRHGSLQKPSTDPDPRPAPESMVAEDRDNFFRDPNYEARAVSVSSRISRKLIQPGIMHRMNLSKALSKIRGR